MSTQGVETLLGNPKTAIIKLAIPMVAAMSAQTIYNLTDAIWVSGQGPESLSAVGFTFPFLFLAMAVANGIGIGGGSAISRRIGAQDKEGADAVASHSFVVMLCCSVIFSTVLFFLARPALSLMGAGAALGLAVPYAKIIFAGMVLLFFMQVALAILRGEGDAKRVMYAMGAGAILNIILDPLFIYSLGLGVAGAAWATVLSMLMVSTVLFYWLFIERKTYVTFRFRGFRFQRYALVDIGRVGFPASISQMSMSLMAFALTTIVASGVASAVTAVTGAAFGARDFAKVRISYLYALRAGVLVEIALALVIFLLAPQITWVFTWSEKSARLVNDLVLFLRVLWLILPTVACGMLSSAMFQGVGKGIYALIMTLIRTLVFTVPFAWFLGVYLGWGLKGIWIGMVSAGLAHIPIALGWSLSYIKKLGRTESGAQT